jgi:hypothetical protein
LRGKGVTLIATAKVGAKSDPAVLEDLAAIVRSLCP